MLQVSDVDPVLLVMPAVGALLFELITTLAVDVQPLDPVTVTA